MIKRLKEHKYAQCHVEFTNKGFEFWSYNTMVISVEYDGLFKVINCTGLYSMTTRKQIGWFLNEYIPRLSYYDIKDSYLKGYSIILDGGLW
jgi:competence transcription factor ComK